MLTPRRATLLLLILTALIYGQTLAYGFVYEDSNDPETFFSLDRPAGNRWITAASYRLSHRVSEMEPWGYHLGNVVVHVGNAALLSAILPATWPAVFAVGLFAMHPLQVETVAYISNRSELLVLTWCLLALLACPRWWLVAVCALGALLTKETGIMVVPLVALWSVWRGYTLSRSAWVSGGLVGALGLLLASRFGLTADGWWLASETTKALWFASRVAWPVNLAVDQDWMWITPLIAVAGLWLGIFALLWSWRSKTVAFVLLWGGLWLLPRLVVPLYEGLHAHHFSGVILGLSLGVGFIAPVSRSLT